MRDDQPGGFGRVLELAITDCGEGQIAERASSFPALVASLRDHALGLGDRIEPIERLEPVDARQAVAALAPAFGIEEVLGQRSRVLLGEAERADSLLDLHGSEDTSRMGAEGWFVVNARDARWTHNELGWYSNFEREDETSFTGLGINLNVLYPGKPMAIYHEEEGQEDFLVLRGECLLIVEGQERPLRQWDFFHCPPFTKHVIVGAGDSPSVVLAVGERGKAPATYPVDETAIRHGVGVTEATDSAREAYAGLSPLEEVPAPEL